MVKLDCNKKLLLTGAGFTHNFGTPLANEMWAWIFNNAEIQAQSKVRDWMLEDFDFESAYYQVMEGNYSKVEKQAMGNAVESAYRKMDSIIRSYNHTEFSKVDLYAVQGLIDKFAQSEKQSFVFTLNQDLFLERQHYNGRRLYLPGIKQTPEWFTTSFKNEIQTPHLIQLPQKQELEKTKVDHLIASKSHYIKLHGSFSWLSSHGSDLLVIGRGKKAKIQKEPLLRWYFEIFESALSEPNRELLLIGYGFRDDHINEIISKAIKSFDLKIYIISPEAPEAFKENLRREKGGKEIWSGLAGYFPFGLEGMFNNQGLSEAGRSLYEHFFGGIIK